MATVIELAPPRTLTMADLLDRLGGIPPKRVLAQPPPGTATEDDLIALLEASEKRLCELVDGVLVEKPMGFKEAVLAGLIVHYIWEYLEEHDIGMPAGADGPVRLRLGLVRIPDACFVSWKRLPREMVPDEPISPVIPKLAIEVLNKSNTPREIALKLVEYFRAGVLLAWVIDPKSQTAVVYTSPTKKRLIGKDGTLTGGRVLPGFKFPLKDLFARGRRRQPRV
jgi:Uma2 family endonuclease